MTNKELLSDLDSRLSEVLINLNQLRNHTVDQLNHKSNSDSWSALECIEHLNLYGDFYLPEIEDRMHKSPGVNSSAVFKSGLIGNYFAKLMLENKQGRIKKMKSPADKKPATSNLNLLVLDRFEKQIHKLRELIHEASSVDLTKTKTAISLTKLIKLRMGDTMRFVVYHMQRHMKQAMVAATKKAGQ